MARNALGAAKTELLGLITSPTLPAGVTAAYGHEPAPGHLAKPVAVSVSTAGMTAIDYLIALRIYVDATADVEQAQEDMDTLIMLIDGRMSSGFGPSNWEVEWNAELGALVALNVFAVGREDQAAFG